MNNADILLPLLVQISLTLIMFILLAVRKSAAVKTGEIDRRKAALDNSAWNKEVVLVSNNIANQFQTPVLFYLLVMFFLITNSVSSLVIWLAWAYVITRIIHAFVHVTTNYIPHRLGVFTLGVLILLVMTGLAFSHYF